MATDTTAPTLTTFVSTVQTTTTITYTVTFSEAVTGVDESAFSLDAAGTDTTASITSVTPVSGSDGASYTVTVSTGGGAKDSTIQLDLTGTKIKDLAGNGYSGGVFQPQTTGWQTAFVGGATQANVATAIAESPEAMGHLAPKIEAGFHIA